MNDERTRPLDRIHHAVGSMFSQHARSAFGPASVGNRSRGSLTSRCGKLALVLVRLGILEHECSGKIGDGGHGGPSRQVRRRLNLETLVDPALDLESARIQAPVTERFEWVLTCG